MKKHEMDRPEIIKLYLTLGELEHIAHCLKIVGGRNPLGVGGEGEIHDMTVDTVDKKIFAMTYNGRRE
jgi:hypothetical protein